VIIITGYPTLESAKQALSLGAYDYLVKPIVPNQVIEASNAAWQHKQWALHSDTGTGRAINELSSEVPAGLPNKPATERTSS
jgi:DNA-binding NtrC family response regulator